MYKTLFMAVGSIASLVNGVSPPVFEIMPKHESRLEQVVNYQRQQELSWEEITKWVESNVDKEYQKFAALDYTKEDIAKKATKLFDSILKIKAGKEIGDNSDTLKNFEVYSNKNGTHKVAQYSEHNLVITSEIASENDGYKYFSISVFVSSESNSYRFTGLPGSYPNSFSAHINGKEMDWNSRNNPLFDIRMLELYVRTIGKMQEITDAYSKVKN